MTTKTTTTCIANNPVVETRWKTKIYSVNLEEWWKREREKTSVNKLQGKWECNMNGMKMRT